MTPFLDKALKEVGFFKFENENVYFTKRKDTMFPFIIMWSTVSFLKFY